MNTEITGEIPHLDGSQSPDTSLDPPCDVEIGGWHDQVTIGDPMIGAPTTRCSGGGTSRFAHWRKSWAVG